MLNILTKNTSIYFPTNLFVHLLSFVVAIRVLKCTSYYQTINVYVLFNISIKQY